MGLHISAHHRRAVLYRARAGPGGNRQISFRLRVDWIRLPARSDQLSPRHAFAAARIGKREPPKNSLVIFIRIDLRYSVGVLELLGPRQMGLYRAVFQSFQNF